MWPQSISYSDQQLLCSLFVIAHVKIELYCLPYIPLIDAMYMYITH